MAWARHFQSSSRTMASFRIQSVLAILREYCRSFFMVEKDTVLWMIKRSESGGLEQLRTFFGVKSPNDSVFLLERLKRDERPFVWWLWAVVFRMVSRAVEILWKKREAEETLVAEILAHLFHGKIQSEGFFSFQLQDHNFSKRLSERLLVAFDYSGALVSFYSGFMDFQVCNADDVDELRTKLISLVCKYNMWKASIHSGPKLQRGGPYGFRGD